MESSMKVLFLVLLAGLLLVNHVAAFTNKDVHEELQSFRPPESEEANSRLMISRFLGGKPSGDGNRGRGPGHIPIPIPLTCDKFPKICYVLGSAGLDCCRNSCVNLATNLLNCGQCGNKCKYTEICCNGKCVNPLSDSNNCGRCNNKCENGDHCSYGLCNYA